MQRLLQLLRGSNSIHDITAERLQQTFGVEFKASKGRRGYSAQISPEWWLAMELDPVRSYGPRFGFTFHPAAPSAYPPATDICQPDFERFEAELQNMGYAQSLYRGEHNRIIHHEFQRAKLMIKVYTLGEAVALLQSEPRAFHPARKCV